MPEIAGQRPAPASLTRGKINDFHRPGKISQETELRGWGTWIARAHHIHARLIQNPKLTVRDIAREEQVSAAYLYSILRLPWLAPDITTAIINGRKPPQLTAQTLMRLTPRLPAGWAEQRRLLGFR